MLDEFALQRRIEALHRCVVPDVAFAAHGTERAMFAEPPAITTRCIRRAAISLMDELRAWSPSHDRPVQRKVIAEMVAHSRLDKATRQKIENDGRKEAALRQSRHS